MTVIRLMLLKWYCKQVHAYYPLLSTIAYVKRWMLCHHSLELERFQKAHQSFLYIMMCMGLTVPMSNDYQFLVKGRRVWYFTQEKSRLASLTVVVVDHRADMQHARLTILDRRTDPLFYTSWIQKAIQMQDEYWRMNRKTLSEFSMSTLPM